VVIVRGILIVLNLAEREVKQEKNTSAFFDFLK